MHYIREAYDISQWRCPGGSEVWDLGARIELEYINLGRSSRERLFTAMRIDVTT